MELFNDWVDPPNKNAQHMILDHDNFGVPYCTADPDDPDIQVLFGSLTGPPTGMSLINNQLRDAARLRCSQVSAEKTPPWFLYGHGSKPMVPYLDVHQGYRVLTHNHMFLFSIVL